MADKRAIPDYEALLSRARSDLPEDLSHESRWALPDLDLMYEGRTTIVRNWKDILETLRRDDNHVFPYVLRELGTAGTSDGTRATLNAKMTDRQINERLQAYADIYVICDECHSPDTHLTKDGRTSLLKCDACGAHRPVRVRKRRETAE